MIPNNSGNVYLEIIACLFLLSFLQYYPRFGGFVTIVFIAIMIKFFLYD